jgi:uncharacterized membrane protein
MNLAHIHLLLNHFPTVGMIVALGIFLLGIVQTSDDLKRAALMTFLGISLLTIPTFVTGSASQEMICKGNPRSPNCIDPGVSKSLIEKHESAAFVGLWFMEATGFLAWLGLWQYRRTSRLPVWNLSAILLLSAVTFGFMANAANLGGEIRHPEIQSAQEKAALQQPLAEEPIARRVGEFIAGGVPWAWAVCETLHFIGLSLLFGIAMLVDLRVLGMIKAVPFSALHRLLPWGILGFGLNVITGMLFFVAAADQYTTNVVFQVKLALILLAGLNVLYFTVFDDPWRLEPGEDATLTSKFVAASAIVLVIGVIYCGRMLPFLGKAF